MNNKKLEQISLLQFSILVFIFITGSAVVVGIGGEAKQDAWIAIGIATIIGMFIFQFYLFLIRKSHNKSFFTLIEYCIGKWLGKCIILVYVFYFFYIAARVLRDFGELMVTTIYPTTPVEVVVILLMVVIAFILGKGVEVLARTSEIFIPYILFFVLFVCLGVVISRELHITQLEPVLGDGIGPVIKALFPTLITFPFGELVAVTFLLPNVSLQSKVNKVAVLTIGASGVVLVLSSVIQIGVLGVSIKDRASFPLLTAAREISLLNFIERVDLVIVFIVMYGIIVKVSIFFYAGLKGLGHIVNIPYRRLVWPLAFQIAFFSILISENVAEHLQEGLKLVPFYLHVPLQFAIPCMLLLILFWKQKQAKQ